MSARSATLGAVAGVLFVLPATAIAQSVDAPVDRGDVVIVDQYREALTDGSGGTTFGLELPAGASCPGDSRNDQWRVQTFIVPAEVDPGTLTYNSIGPEGSGRYALYDLDTNPVSDVLTSPNGAPGLPGLIVGLRSMSFEIFPPGTLPDGVYRVGVACTYFRDTASFWDTTIEVTRDPNDLPAELRWEVGSPPTGATSGIPDDRSSGAGSFGIIVLALAAVIAAVLYFGRRSRRQPAHHEEKT